MTTVNNTGYWTFFCNPAKWQIDEFLLSGKKVDYFGVTSWQEKYFKPGQLGLIRVGKDNRTKKLLGKKKKLESGVYAIVKVLSRPTFRQKADDKFWLKPKEIDLKNKAVKIRYIWASLEQPLLIEDIKKIKDIKDKYLIDGFQASSMPLEESSFNKVQKMLENSDSKNNKDGWSHKELESTIEAYMEMLDCEENGISYSKAKIRKKLLAGPLQGRSQGSIEYRMQNISAVLNNQGRTWVLGYKPAKNVGKAVEKRIASLIQKIEERNETPTADSKELERRTKKLRTLYKKKKKVGRPKGQSNPESVETKSKTYKRDPEVKAFILNVANGICEMCNKSAPFIGADDEPFLEVHHVLHLADGGPDTTENAVALCPNCHRELHYGNRRKSLIKSLMSKIGRLK